jgi:hypothetical protein
VILTSMSITALNALYASAAAAFDAGDYDAAIAAATKAQVLLGTTPNLARGIGGGNQSITWNDGAAVARFIADCRRIQKATAINTGGPFRQSKVTYSRAEASDV